jgi:ribosomal protein L7/L12
MSSDIKDLLEAVVMSLVAIFVLAWEIGAIQTRQRIQRARARGVWPPLGQIPTDEDLKRLVKAGEKLLAIKMCRQIHNMGFTEAKAVVERLAEQADAGDGK